MQQQSTLPCRPLAEALGFLFTMFGEQDRAEHYALERAVTNRANPETAKAIHDVVDLVFGVAA